MRYLIVMLLVLVSNVASATEWYVGNILISNVCSNAFFTWVYPYAWAQPVGTSCRLPNGALGIVGG